MKQCPQCRQNYSDDILFCLSDGTPLIEFVDDPEEMTVIKPLLPGGQTTPPTGTGQSKILFILAGGLVLLLLAMGAIGIAIFAVSRNWKTENSNTVTSNINSSNNDGEISQFNKEKANLQEQQNQLEKEKQRLADERKKLNEAKNKPVESPLPTSTLPPPTTSYPAQPTARIKFGRGRVAESISGKIYTQRSFVLQARSGQYLSASVSGGGCVTFSNGGTSLGYVTGQGDNRVTLVNNCNTEASFSLTVSIK